MNLLSRRMHLFCVSNIVVSFVCTGFLGTNYYNTAPEVEQKNEQEVVSVDDTLPLSQTGSEKEVSNNTKKVTVSSSNNKKVTSVVKKKDVKASVKYVPAKYNEITGTAIVDYAKKYLGLRYVSNGYSLTNGTDCSGFTKLIYKEFGITLSRVVSGQAKSGTYVSKSDLQKGDLVFYSSGGSKPTHVAIYIGDGRVIHESNHRDGVKYSSVNMMQYITARRVINDTANKIAAEKNNINNEVNNSVVTESNTTNSVDNTNVDNTNTSVNTSNSVNENITINDATPTPDIIEESKNETEENISLTVSDTNNEDTILSTPTPSVQESNGTTENKEESSNITKEEKIDNSKTDETNETTTE